MVNTVTLDWEQIAPRPSQGHSPATSPVPRCEMLQTPGHCTPRPTPKVTHGASIIFTGGAKVLVQMGSQHSLPNCLAPSIKK